MGFNFKLKTNDQMYTMRYKQQEQCGPLKSVFLFCLLDKPGCVTLATCIFEQFFDHLHEFIN